METHDTLRRHAAAGDIEALRTLAVHYPDSFTRIVRGTGVLDHRMQQPIPGPIRVTGSGTTVDPHTYARPSYAGEPSPDIDHIWGSERPYPDTVRGEHLTKQRESRSTTRDDGRAVNDALSPPVPDQTGLPGLGVGLLPYAITVYGLGMKIECTTHEGYRAALKVVYG